MFGIGIPELAVILVVAVIVFGPDRLPEFARQAGRFVREFRKFTEAAQTELRNELGPEYANLKLTDLDPRVAIRKHILEAMEDDPVEETRSKPANNAMAVPLAADERAPYDSEAT